MTMPRSFRFAQRLALAAGLALCLAGCSGYTPGGSGVTGTAETYESTTHFQPTVSLVDTSTNETIWSVDVPVGKQLVIVFGEEHNKSNPTRPALMRWGIMNRGSSGGLDNSIPAPDATSRRIDVRKTAPRPAPTMAPAPPPPVTPPPAPAPKPAAPEAPKPKN